MDCTYSITTRNKFDLAQLAEDQDPLELLKIREQEKEAKKKERLSEKENKQKHSAGADSAKNAGNKQPKPPRVIKESHQQNAKPQEPKKEQGEKKPVQPRPTGGERNVKFPAESREERNNRRNREEGDTRPPRDNRRGPPGEHRENREFRGSNNDSSRGDFGERRFPPRGDRVERGERGGERGDRVERGGERGGERHERGERGERGGPRGTGGNRGSRTGPPRTGGKGGFDSRGKREFDRQSGSDKTRRGYSGIKPVDKKDGAGSHNWGTHNDEIEESLNQSENPEFTADKSDPDASQLSTGEGKEGETNPEATTEEKPAEEEARELTLDEWKALRSGRNKPQYNLRKAGEGEDLSQWKKMYVLEKKKEPTEEEEEEEVEDYDVATEYPQRVGRQKHVVGIEFQFNDSRRNAGGRTGRGGRGARGERNPRGFGNRGGAPREGGAEPRPPQPQPGIEQRSPRGRPQNAPKVDDEHDFPSLG